MQGIVQLCAEEGVAIVPFGCGTSLEGHIKAVFGGVCVDVGAKMTRILSENLEDQDVRCEAGVTRLALNRSLRHSGLQFMVDPGADATIGGMAACGASGTMAVRYGTMRENVLSLTAVLANGQIVDTGCRSRKSSAGYDLTRLLVGSEGTLGVLTEIGLRVHPVPAHIAAATVTFPSGVRCAADAVLAMLALGLPLRRCELLDAATVAAFNRYNAKQPDIPELATLFLELADVSPAGLEHQVDLARLVADENYGTNFQSSDDEAKATALWAARHSTYYAALALKPNGHAIVTDACVPLSKLADVIQATVDDVSQSNVVGPVFGHAGDGNIHCILCYNDQDDQQYLDRLYAVNSRIVARAIAAGGTCTGEHGVGVGKRSSLRAQYSSATIDTMVLIKRALDPSGVMNPGKIL